MEQHIYHYYIFHKKDLNLKQKIQEFDCVEHTSIQVTIPVEREQLNMPDPHRSLVSITTISDSSFKQLDEQLTETFEEIWFKQ